MLLKFWNEEDGQDLVEYALLMAFVAIAGVAVMTSISSGISTLWQDISNALSDAVSSAA